MPTHLVIGCLLSIFLRVTTLPAQEATAPLFNGKDLTGWYGNDPHRTRGKDSLFEQYAEVAAQQASFAAHWHVEDGELVNDGQGAYATTVANFGDVELALEYKTVAMADSGIYLKGAPQVQIWDTTEAGGKWKINADKGSGGLYNNSQGSAGQLPLVHADKPFGEWNRVKIVQVGSRTSVTLNDRLVVDWAVMENYWDKDRPLPAQGPIHLQTHGGEIRWRDIQARRLGSEEANRLLRGNDQQQGFEPLFNGSDFSGWQGATENYEIIGGTMRCRPNRGGNLFTEEQFDDFIVRFEFQLPPGGNNGLAIRYPGEGDPAYVGMAELQILDNTAEQYAGLDERQYHGSAYGLSAAQRGYLRPVGEWNYQEVTVQGSRIKVELNGTIILDTDLEGVEHFLADRPHPGKKRRTGYLGFAGHNDPVAFRNVAVKRLKSASVATGVTPTP